MFFLCLYILNLEKKIKEHESVCEKISIIKMSLQKIMKCWHKSQYFMWKGEFYSPVFTVRTLQWDFPAVFMQTQTTLWGATIHPAFRVPGIRISDTLGAFRWLNASFSIISQCIWVIDIVWIYFSNLNKQNRAISSGNGFFIF